MGRLWMTGATIVGGIVDLMRGIAGRCGLGGDKRPDTRGFGLSSSVVRFGCPPFDGAQESASNHLLGHSQRRQYPAGTLKDGD
jgi:hypothetical protein